MQGLSIGETRQRVCTWRAGFEAERRTTLSRGPEAGAGGIKKVGYFVRPP